MSKNKPITRRVTAPGTNQSQIAKTVSGCVCGRTGCDERPPSMILKAAPMKVAKPVPTIIHVNQNVIRSNLKHGTNRPALTFRKGRNGKKATPAHEVEILGPSKIIHSPHDPLPCGARVWIETFGGIAFK